MFCSKQLTLITYKLMMSLCPFLVDTKPMKHQICHFAKKCRFKIFLIKIIFQSLMVIYRVLVLCLYRGGESEKGLTASFLIYTQNFFALTPNMKQEKLLSFNHVNYNYVYHKQHRCYDIFGCKFYCCCFSFSYRNA